MYKYSTTDQLKQRKQNDHLRLITAWLSIALNWTSHIGQSQD